MLSRESRAQECAISARLSDARSLLVLAPFAGGWPGPNQSHSTLHYFLFARGCDSTPLFPSNLHLPLAAWRNTVAFQGQKLRYLSYAQAEASSSLIPQAFALPLWWVPCYDSSYQEKSMQDCCNKSSQERLFPRCFLKLW